MFTMCYLEATSKHIFWELHVASLILTVVDLNLPEGAEHLLDELLVEQPALDLVACHHVSFPLGDLLHFRLEGEEIHYANKGDVNPK